MRSQLLATMAKIVGCDIFAYVSVDPASGRSERVMDPDPSTTAELDTVFSQHLSRHPLLGHFMRTGNGDATRLSDVVSQRDLRRSEFYQGFYRPLGIRHQMAFVLDVDLGVVNALVLSRGRSDFKDVERQLVRVAQPHLAHLASASAAHSWFASALAALNGIDDTAYGVVLLGPMGKVRVMNRAARLLLATYFRTSVREGAQLPDELAAWLAEQRRPASDGPPQPYTAARGSRRLTVKLFRHHGSAALLMSESSVNGTPATEATGLTARESDVLWLVANGRTSAQAAQILQISSRTVEKHLENIYAKLGATSRTEASLRVFGTPAARARQRRSQP